MIQALKKSTVIWRSSIGTDLIADLVWTRSEVNVLEKQIMGQPSENIAVPILCDYDERKAFKSQDEYDLWLMQQMRLGIQS